MTGIRALSFLAFILIASPALAGTVFHLEEPWFDTVEVTLRDGRTAKLDGARLSFPGGNRNYLSDHAAYLPVFEAAAFPRLVLVHSSKILEARFQPRGTALDVEVSMDGGALLHGEVAEPATELMGWDKEGKRTIRLADLRSLRFVGFGIGMLREGSPLSRTAAAARWWAVQGRTSRTYTILDGADSVSGEGWLGFLDSYSVEFATPTGRSESTATTTTIYVQSSGVGLESAIRSDAHTTGATSSGEVDLAKLSRLELTGKAAGGCHEAIIAPSDGSRPTVCLSGRVDEKTLGPFDKFDYLLWGKPFGFEGTPLLPIRRIVATVTPTPQRR